MSGDRKFTKSGIEYHLRNVYSDDGKLPQDSRPLYLGDIADIAFRSEGRVINEKYFHKGSSVSPTNVERVTLVRAPHKERDEYEIGAAIHLKETIMHPQLGPLEFLLIDKIFVIPDYQKKGIMQEMVLDGISYGSKTGLPVLLRAIEHNDERYRKLGGVHVPEGKYIVRGWAPGHPKFENIRGFEEIAKYVASKPSVLTPANLKIPMPHGGFYNMSSQELQIA